MGVKGVKRSLTFETEDLGSNQRPAAHSMDLGKETPLGCGLAALNLRSSGSCCKDR